MTEMHHVRSSEDLQALPLAGACVTSVVVGEHSVDLILGFADARSAVIRIESAASLNSQGADREVIEAGPDLGHTLISLLGDVVVEQNASALDLVLKFGRGGTLQIYVDESGYESYEVTIEGVTYVASRAVP